MLSAFKKYCFVSNNILLTINSLAFLNTNKVPISMSLCRNVKMFLSNTTHFKSDIIDSYVNYSKMLVLGNYQNCLTDVFLMAVSQTQYKNIKYGI